MPNPVAFNKLTLHVILEFLKAHQTQTTEITTCYDSYPSLPRCFLLHPPLLPLPSVRPAPSYTITSPLHRHEWVGLGNPGLPSAAEQLQEMFLAEIKSGILLSPSLSD